MAYLEDRVTHLENEVSILTKTIGMIFKYILEPYHPVASTPVVSSVDTPVDVPTNDEKPNSSSRRRLYSTTRPLNQEQGKEWINLILSNKDQFLKEYKKYTKKEKNGCVLWTGSYTTTRAGKKKETKFRIPQTRSYRSVGIPYINTRVAYWAVLNKQPVLLSDRVTNTCKVEGCVAKEHLKFLTAEDTLYAGLMTYQKNLK